MCLKVQSVHIWNSFIKDLEKNAISCRSQQASHFFSLGENEFPKYFPSGEISSLNIFHQGKLFLQFYVTLFPRRKLFPYFSPRIKSFPKYFPSGEISSLDLSPSSLSVGVLVGFQELDPVTRWFCRTSLCLQLCLQLCLPLLCEILSDSVLSPNLVSHLVSHFVSHFVSHSVA